MTVRITTANLNGIRAAARKGFFDWFTEEAPDVLCVQETKAQYDQLAGDATYFPEGWHAYFEDAEKKGYSGVALYSRVEPDDVIRGVGFPEIDREGRWIEARYGNLSVVSFYMPSGTSGDHRQGFKYAFMDPFMAYLAELRKGPRSYIICGDWNIAHTKLDLRNWRSNQKNSGFLPEERAWLDRLFDEVGLVDAFRVVEPETEQYTWWSYRGQAWANNTGWRIDYEVITPDLREAVRSASIYEGARFSDHAPMTLAYDLTLG
ncbi:exodeoxyribonuclease III [Arhodomonas aquaeolei]|uniref:exodeoxyribonuclease III n=1 Tax=Arhodomonas aquaeolei TaxID=2369 RepID=UPI0003638DAC|nr:exodeoxyribonuclease III [Arhodomonas aquaeolei]